MRTRRALHKQETLQKHEGLKTLACSNRMHDSHVKEAIKLNLRPFLCGDATDRFGRGFGASRGTLVRQDRLAAAGALSCELGAGLESPGELSSLSAPTSIRDRDNLPLSTRVSRRLSLPGCNENKPQRMRLCGLRRTPRVEFILQPTGDQQKIILQKPAMTLGLFQEEEWEVT